jgi:transaldolase/glucose-6-phosphate isomerase
VTDFSIDPGLLAPALDTVFSQLNRDGFANQLWARHTGLWSDDYSIRQSIGNRLGWLDAVEFAASNLPRVDAFVRRVRARQFTDVVLFGMGGSSLAPEVFHRLFGRDGNLPRFSVLDSTDPTAVRDAISRADTSLFIIASKSGTTIEPNAMAAAARRRVEAAGVKDWASRFVAITDDQTPLHRRALNDSFFDVFVNPSDVGGRYSALTLFGIVPAALIGVPLETVLKEARRMTEACRAEDSRTNPGVALGALIGTAAREGRDTLTLMLPPRLEPLALWVEQLVAESTGKHGKGIVPIAGEPPEVAAAADRVVVIVRLDGVGIDDTVRSTLKSAGVPMMTIDMPVLEALGAEFFRWEIATATAGRILEINPFDEPNVQQAKDATRALLDAYATRGELPVPAADLRSDGIEITFSAAARRGRPSMDLDAFLNQLKPRDYFALLAYVPPDDDRFAPWLTRIRNGVAVNRRCATVVGYGPRYLHSTGQLHKGGPNNGVFLIITAPPENDLPVPDAPYSFGVLEMAQAIGDFQSLDRANRRAARVHLPDRSPDSLARLANLLRISQRQV